jgi:hypothetical protein
MKAGALAPGLRHIQGARALAMSSVRPHMPHYIKNRTRQVFYELCHEHSHWLCPEALQFLDGWLAPSDVGFQWGSDDGTLWLAQRVGHVTCIEHDPAQAQVVQAQLEAEGLDERVSYHVESHGNAMENIDAAYVCMIDRAADYSLDFCLVGGPLRSACCLASILKLKYGGLLVLEDADRYLSHDGELDTVKADWDGVVWHLAPWRQIWTSNGLSETAIFIKP